MTGVVNGSQRFTAALPHKVDYFKDGEQDADKAGDHHKYCEDAFLCGTSDEAVHLVWTGFLLTLDERWEVIAFIDTVQEVHKGGIHNNLEKQGQNIGPPEASTFLASVLVKATAVVAMFEAIFSFPVFSIGHMHHHQERGTSDKNELQSPQANMGNGEEMVKADIVAARLCCVACKVLLLISPHLLGSHNKDHHPKDKNDRQPHPPESCRILVDSTEKALKECPVHDEVDLQSFPTRSWERETPFGLTVKSNKSR